MTKDSWFILTWLLETATGGLAAWARVAALLTRVSTCIIVLFICLDSNLSNLKWMILYWTRKIWLFFILLLFLDVFFTVRASPDTLSMLCLLRWEKRWAARVAWKRQTGSKDTAEIFSCRKIRGQRDLLNERRSPASKWPTFFSYLQSTYWFIHLIDLLFNYTFNRPTVIHSIDLLPWTLVFGIY